MVTKFKALYARYSYYTCRFVCDKQTFMTPDYYGSKRLINDFYFGDHHDTIQVNLKYTFNYGYKI